MVGSLNGDHNCTAESLGVKYGVANSNKWLCEILPKIITINVDTTPKAIIEQVQLYYGLSVNYEVCTVTICQCGCMPVTRMCAHR